MPYSVAVTWQEVLTFELKRSAARRRYLSILVVETDAQTSSFWTTKNQTPANNVVSRIDANGVSSVMDVPMPAISRLVHHKAFRVSGTGTPTLDPMLGKPTGGATFATATMDLMCQVTDTAAAFVFEPVGQKQILLMFNPTTVNRVMSGRNQVSGAATDHVIHTEIVLEF